MLFTSYTFIGFILVLFIIYYSIPRRLQWVLLLGASYLFYACAGPRFLLYILATTTSTYFTSMKLDALDQVHGEGEGQLPRADKPAYRAAAKAKKLKWLLACLLFNFGILAVVKYANFTIYNINSVLQTLGSGKGLSFLSLALPMGISFYTFQTMGYIIDVYRGKHPAERNFFKLALFVSFFPQLVQGPISRYEDLAKTLYGGHAFSFLNLNFGLQRILWGYFKKLVIADRILVAVNTLVRNPQQYQGAFVLVGMLFYAYQLYADFTGGIDITIGIAEVMGIRVKENFNSPFLAKSIADYWRRWHISLGAWFRDYLFYPLSVSRPLLKFSRFSRRKLGPGLGKRLPVYLATIAVWFTTGLWHGASWNFIMWGLANGAVLIASQECQPFYKWFHRKFPVKDTLAFRSFQVVRTVLLMSCIRMFDCYRDVPTTFRMFGTLFSTFNLGEVFNGALLKLGLTMADYWVLLASLIVLFASCFFKQRGSIRQQLAQKPLVIRCLAQYALIIAIILFGAYGVGYDASQFIYNQF